MASELRGFGAEIDLLAFRVTREDFLSWRTFRKWAISAGGAINRVHRMRRCWWPHGWVKLLGFQIGAGIYIDRGPFAAQSLPDHSAGQRES